MDVSAFLYEKGDLFKTGSNWRLNACVGLNGGPYQFDAYCRGYFHAGRRLVEEIILANRDIDLLVYPTVYVYRHAIELGLKHIARSLSLIEPGTPKIRLTHRLIDNWRIIRARVEALEDFDPECLAFVDDVLADFIAIDPSGETFRYPENRTGYQHLVEKSHINLGSFAAAMIPLGQVFEYWFAILGALIEESGEDLSDLDYSDGV